MITRFEKRVVAVILAVILAIPLSGLPSVAVQAEEAENITDAPQPEQPDVAEEQQEGGETEQTEEGAFIPIIGRRASRGRRRWNAAGGEPGSAGAGDARCTAGAFIGASREESQCRTAG